MEVIVAKLGYEEEYETLMELFDCIECCCAETNDDSDDEEPPSRQITRQITRQLSHCVDIELANQVSEMMTEERDLPTKTDSPLRRRAFI